MVEMLNATVIIRVIPALERMVLNSFVMARLDIPSKGNHAEEEAHRQEHGVDDKKAPVKKSLSP